MDAPLPLHIEDIERLIIEHEVRIVLQTVSPKKAPGADGIINKTLYIFTDQLVLTLIPLFNASLDVKYYPQHFRNALTITLQKPNKDDYWKAKSYRLVALLSTIRKIFKGILAARLSQVVENYNILLRKYLEGWKGTSREIVVYIVVDKIHTIQRVGKTASFLILDVLRAFDNISHKRLLYNLRKRKIGLRITIQIRSFITDCQTRLNITNRGNRTRREVISDKHHVRD